MQGSYFPRHLNLPVQHNLFIPFAAVLCALLIRATLFAYKSGSSTVGLRIASQLSGRIPVAAYIHDINFLVTRF